MLKKKLKAAITIKEIAVIFFFDFKDNNKAGRQKFF